MDDARPEDVVPARSLSTQAFRDDCVRFAEQIRTMPPKDAPAWLESFVLTWAESLNRNRKQ